MVVASSSSASSTDGVRSGSRVSSNIVLLFGEVVQTRSVGGEHDNELDPRDALRFRSPDVEADYLSDKFERGKGLLVWLWAFLTPVLMCDIYLTHQHLDNGQYPTGLKVLCRSHYVALAIAQVPLFVRFCVARADIAEWICLVFDLAVALLLAFPMNKWRCGFVFHGDGHYLYDSMATSHTSDTIWLSCFFVFTMFYLPAQFIRYRAVRWHSVVKAMIFVCFSGLIDAGMSPEKMPDVVMSLLLMGVFVAVLRRTKESHEYADRMNFMSLQRLRQEAQDYKDREMETLEQERRLQEERDLEKLRGALACAVENEDSAGIAQAMQGLQDGTKLAREELVQMERDIRRQQSHERGVRLTYLLSGELQALALRASGKPDPTFYDLKEAFFLGPRPIGRDVICPRDGMRGCALVDTLPCMYRGKCTHFLSWTWAYSLSMVRECLERWASLSDQGDFSKVSFFMCFFVNNQYRIFAPTGPGSGSDAKGSDNLEHTFEAKLSGIGKVVALLDTFDRPLYLTRIWTIFEQFTASKLNIDVEIVMPEASARLLIGEFEQGKLGIQKVRDSMANVSSSCARASDKADEEKVKDLIRQHGGFDMVDSAIKQVMTVWVARELRNHMAQIMEVTEEEMKKGVTFVEGAPVSRGSTRDIPRRASGKRNSLVLSER